MRQFLLTALFLVTHLISAQTVFIPDVQLRAKLNLIAPGVVDPNGYLDDQSGSMLPDTVHLVVDWTPADLTGVEYLYSWKLKLEFIGVDQLTWNGIAPGGFADLELVGYPLTSIPYVGEFVISTLKIIDAPVLQELPLITNLAVAIQLVDVPQLEPPTFADGLGQLDIYNYPMDLAWPVIPSSVWWLRLMNIDRSDLPSWPAGLFELEFTNMRS